MCGWVGGCVCVCVCVLVPMSLCMPGGVCVGGVSQEVCARLCLSLTHTHTLFLCLSDSLSLSLSLTLSLSLARSLALALSRALSLSLSLSLDTGSTRQGSATPPTSLYSCRATRMTPSNVLMNCLTSSPRSHTHTHTHTRIFMQPHGHTLANT